MTTELGRITNNINSETDGYYDVVLVDSGQPVQAILAMPARGSSTRLEPNDHVLCHYVSGCWVIHGVIPQYVKTQGSAAPRNASLNPGDQFFGNSETAAGVHVQGGMVSVEASGVTSEGKISRAAHSIWVPDSDAIRNLCRRFDIDAATGNVQMLHDDKTGQTAFRIWSREQATTGQDGRTSRIHMGYHRSPPGAVMSVTTFPGGPDPVDGKLDFAFKMNPVQEAMPFAGQWPILERDDWQTRYYVMKDGTAIFESAMVPAPSIKPTTSAEAKVRVIITPEGFITTTADQLVTLNAMNNLIALKQSYTMTANTALFTVKQFFNVNAETITLLTKGGAPASVIVGDVGESLPLCNFNLFTWILEELIPFLVTHTHAGVQTGGGVSGPAIGPVAIPGETSVTKATHAS